MHIVMKTIFECVFMEKVFQKGTQMSAIVLGTSHEITFSSFQN